MTNLVRTTLCSTALILFAAAQPVHALMIEVGSPESFVIVSEDDQAYASGTRAMDEHRWPDAVTAFDKVISEKGDRVDAALYWKAYSLNKLGKMPLAVATCDQLRSQFANSTWNKDCAALSVDSGVDPRAMADQARAMADQARIKMKTDQIRPMIKIAPFDRYIGEEDNGVPRGSDEDLKILAINSLMNKDPTAALPLLRGILTSNQSINVKKHALFVLAQSKSPEAESVLHDAALGKLDPQLQEEAIRSMAVFQGKRANDTLAEVYRTTTDPKIKKSIISSMFITKDATRLVEMARNEKDLELKRTIVSHLALMNDKAATDYMMELLK
jgi:HEAT repeat protein